MKKTYIKPTVEILSLTGNEQICGACADKGGELLYKNPESTQAGIIDTIVAINGYGEDDGVLTKQEASKAFGPDESCVVEIEYYCKFTSTGDMVAWS